MSDLYDDNIDSIEGWGVLLVDAFNAFNSLNHIAMLLHACILWLQYSRFLFNSYRGWSVLVLRDSSDFLYCREGVVYLVNVYACCWYITFDIFFA